MLVKWYTIHTSKRYPAQFVLKSFFLLIVSVANSPGGCAYEREVTPPDWVLDYWHPLEKAQYPEYFARREERKKEYVIWWEKQYGKPAHVDNSHLENILR